MKRVIVIYGRPDDPAAFDSHYAERHVPLVRKMPHLKEFRYSRGPVIASDAENTPHLVAELTYESEADLDASLSSEAGQAAVADLENFATGGVKILTVELENAA